MLQFKRRLKLVSISEILETVSEVWGIDYEGEKDIASPEGEMFGMSFLQLVEKLTTTYKKTSWDDLSYLLTSVVVVDKFMKSDSNSLDFVTAVHMNIARSYIKAFNYLSECHYEIASNYDQYLAVVAESSWYLADPRQTYGNLVSYSGMNKSYPTKEQAIDAALKAIEETYDEITYDKESLHKRGCGPVFNGNREFRLFCFAIR